MKKNLILSISDGYNYYDLARFVESLAKSGFRGHVCVFIGPMTKFNTIEQLHHAGIETIQYENTFPFITSPHPENFKSLPYPIHLWNFRHFLYYNYLLEYGNQYDQVFLTDIRDVVFQGDPFGFELGDMLNIAMEDRTTKIVNAYPNPEWIMYGYGAGMLAELSEDMVSCAGTILGITLVIKNYLHTLLTEINGLNDALHCADQAAHNVLLHKGKLTPVRRLYNEDSPILTIGTVEQGSKFQFDAEGFVLNKQAERPSIVHQYDRHPELLAKMDRIAFDGNLRKRYLQVRYLVFFRRKYQDLLRRLKAKETMAVR